MSLLFSAGVNLWLFKKTATERDAWTISNLFALVSSDPGNAPVESPVWKGSSTTTQ